MEISITPKELAEEIGHADGGKRIRGFLRSSLVAGHVKHQSWVLSPETADIVRAHFKGTSGRKVTLSAAMLESPVQVLSNTDSKLSEPVANRRAGHRQCQTQFGQLCAESGLRLASDPRVEGLTNRGHLSTSLRNSQAVVLLKQIFEALGGDERDLRLVSQRLLESDFLHNPTRTFIEIDEIQHFTSHRRVALELYPDDIELGFDRDEYLQLIEQHHTRADRAFAHKSARGFGSRGRPRQRAYLDAVRDLALPAMGYSPVVRVAAPEGISVIAFERFSSSGHLDALLPRA